jgi:hypothetical protein
LGDGEFVDRRVNRQRGQRGALRPEQIRAIRSDPRPHTTIAKDYDTTQPMVSAIKARKAYKEIL